MSESHDRRSFFKHLLRGAASTAQEVGQAFKEAQAFDEPGGPLPDDYLFGATYEQRPVAAAPATGTATAEELRTLAAEVGLEGRADDALAHARRSIRLTPGHYGGRTRLGGAPDIPAGFEWPTWRDEPLTFLGQIDLAETRAAGADEALPATGLLLFFFDVDRRPDGMAPDERGAWRVVHVDGELEPAPVLDALVELPVQLSTELTLPSELGGFPSSLVLGGPELDMWQRLRERLAELQGVELEDRALDWHALHRLGGHPDTTEEGMQVDAQLVVHGIDLNTGDRWVDPRVADLERQADQWRLLLQLSSDDELGLELGYPLGRLYVFARDGDLRQGRFDDVWAFLR